MPRLTLIARVLGALFASVLPLSTASAEPPTSQPATTKSAIALFDGASLSGWRGAIDIDPRELAAMAEPERISKQAEWTREAHQHWRVENGELIGDGDGPFLATDAGFGDFELDLEYKLAPGADTGVYLRGTPQIQLWDHTDPARAAGGADKGSGGLWNNRPGSPGRFPAVVADNPVGEWNRLRVIMVGAYVTSWLNDQLVVDHAIMENAHDAKSPRMRPMVREGPIVLQTHGGETRWRNIQIREISPALATTLLGSGGPARGNEQEAGWRAIFNGRDFSGWRGPVEQNAIADGAILSSHGTIYTEEEYDDFVVRFEFQLPKKGNNGLAIRYPGEGDTAYVGMCELQVLDDPRYGDLKPQQAHGSAYGMVAADGGYLRDVGEWNYQVVTVRGSTIRVELNGFTILDADLSNVTDPMHPIEDFVGRTRTRGHFGFAGHGDPVKYRNIHIKRLK